MIQECFKHGFLTYQIAREVANKNKIHKDKVKLRVYRCPLCHQWHLTKIKNVKRNHQKNKTR